MFFWSHSKADTFPFYRSIKKTDDLNDPKKNEPTYQFDLQMHRYFLSLTEKMISDELKDLFFKGNQLTENLIIEKAKYYYNLP